MIRNQMRATALSDQLSTATTTQVPGILEQLQENRWAQSKLSALQDDQSATPEARFRAFAASSGPQPDMQPFVHDYLLNENTDFKSLSLALSLADHKLQKLVDTFRNDLENDSLHVHSRLNAGLLLGNLTDCTSTAGNVTESTDSEGDCWERHSEFIANELIRESITNKFFYSELIQLGKPLKEQLSPTLKSAANDYSDSSRQQAAVTLLRDFFMDDPVRLADNFLDLSPTEIDPVLPALRKHQDLIIPHLESAAMAVADPRGDVGSYSNRSANAAALLGSFGRFASVWPALKFDPESTVQARTIHTLGMFGVSCEPFVNHYPDEPDVSIRRAILLAMGELYRKEPTPKSRREILAIGRRAFEADPDSGVHAAAEWLLINMEDQSWLSECKSRLASPITESIEEKVDWRITKPRTMTFVRLDARSETKIGYRVEVCATEVSVKEFREFNPDYDDFAEVPHDFEDGPMSVVSWFHAVDYCRWLTEQEGFGEEDQCYPLNEKSEMIEIHPDYRTRRGYRLLTSEEWKLARRAGSVVEPIADLPPFAMGHFLGIAIRSDAKPWPAGRFMPNGFGLFHTSGNVAEWLTEREKHQYARTPLTYAVPISKVGSSHDLLKAVEDIGFQVPGTRFRSVGFRIARTIVETPVKTPAE